LGGQTLQPGVYCFDTSAQLTGNLVLDALGDANAVRVFKTGSTLTTASGAVVRLTNGGQALNGFWQVGSSATLGTTTQFSGNILADQSLIGDLSGTTNPTQVTMDANKVITATFRTNRYLSLVQRNTQSHQSHPVQAINMRVLSILPG